MDFVACATALKECGYYSVDNFLDASELSGLREHFHFILGQGAFRKAGIGKSAVAQDEIRGDEIYWWETATFIPTQDALYARLDALKAALNRELFLGLRSLEVHYAHYAPGSFYRRHLDRFQNDDARAVSLVLYLNETWEPSDGGELALYPFAREPDRAEKISPRPGTLALFLSDQIEHEVLPTLKSRMSLTGWFRRSTFRG